MTCERIYNNRFLVLCEFTVYRALQEMATWIISRWLLVCARVTLDFLLFLLIRFHPFDFI